MDQESLTRREVLMRGGMLAAAAAASASAFTPAVARAMSQTMGLSGTLHFMGFQGDDLPKLMKPWLAKRGVALQSTYIGSAADIAAKLSGPGGGGGVDLLDLPGNAKRTLSNDLGLFRPLDPRKLPNLSALHPIFKGRHFRFFLRDERGRLVAVPYGFTTFSITVNTNTPARTIKSWNDMLLPAYKGRVVLQDIPFGVLAAACAMQGLNMGRLRKSDLPKVTDFLKRVVAQAKSLAPTAGDAAAQLNSREAWVVFPGGAFIDAISKAQGGSGVRTLAKIQGGGTPVFLSLYAIAKEADNPDAAYAFINHVLAPKNNAYAADFIGQGTIVPAAVKMVKTNRTAFAYGSLGAFLKSAPIYFNPPVSSDQYVTVPEWLTTWAQIKAGG